MKKKKIITEKRSHWESGNEWSTFPKQLSVSLKIYLFTFSVLWNEFAFCKEQNIFSWYVIKEITPQKGHFCVWQCQVSSVLNLAYWRIKFMFHKLLMMVFYLYTLTRLSVRAFSNILCTSNSFNLIYSPLIPPKAIWRIYFLKVNRPGEIRNI